jgi:tetratricopeptide (TPR) repeat protein
VSLLMDALKKAEQAKQQGTVGALAASAPPLALEPVIEAPPEVVPEVSTGPANLPELPKLEDLDDEFLAHAKQSAANPLGPTTATQHTLPPDTAGRSAPAASMAASSSPRQAGTATAGGDTHSAVGAPASRADQQAVRNAFAVKQRPGNGRVVLAAGVLGLLAVAGIGTYFWLQLKPSASLIVQRPSTPAVSAGLALNSQSPRPPAIEASAPAKQPPVPTASGSSANADSAQPIATKEVTKPKRALTPPPVGGADGTFAGSPIHLTSALQAKPNAAAIDAFEAYQAGNLEAAKLAYERLLQADPRNLDALHGLAAVAQREGRTNDAEALYARILDTNPRDAQAQAGLLGLHAQRGLGDPVVAESRIKSMLASQPDSAALQFALGNLYARQNRWSEAQQAYFQAQAGDANNPDYLFNLAVSLDQLHQPKLAEQYYRRALAAAEGRPASFDSAQATSRLRELQP